jgi:signal peptidase II
MSFIFFVLFAVAIVVADQLTKLWVVAQIPLYSQVEALDGLFHLTYVRNFGAAFSSFQGMRWVFVVLFVLLTAALLYEYFKKPMPFNTFERWCLAAIWGGGLGNVIDRVRLGYVVDMIEVEFITFPVFNVADCFITCGCIALMVSLILFNKGFWKEDKK